MRRLELLKGLVSLIILASVFNDQMDLLRIPRSTDVHIALAVLCLTLFAIGLYHDRLSRSLVLRSKREEHQQFPFSKKARSDLLFTEGLSSFLFAIPVIPTFIHFQDEVHLGMGILLFPLHGLIRCLRAYRGDHLQLVLGEDRIVFTLRSARSILYSKIREARIKYEHIYFILKDGRVEDIPLSFLGEENALSSIRERLNEKGVKNRIPAQEEEASRSGNSKE